MNNEILPKVWGRRLLALLTLVGVLAAFYALRTVVLPFLLAWIAAYLVSPIVDVLEKRWKGRRESAVLFVMAVVLLGLTLAVVVSVPIIIQESTMLAKKFPEYRAAIMTEVEYWQAEGRIAPEARNLAVDALEKLQEATPQIATFLGQWLMNWLSSLLGIFGVLLDFLLFAFVFYYFLCDFHLVNQRILMAIPARHHARIRPTLAEIDLNLRTVLRGQLMVALAMGACYTVALTFAGVPYAVLIGPISGLGNFLPYVGPMLGMIPAFLFTILHYPGDMTTLGIQTLWIIGIFGVVQLLESYWLTPKLAGQSVGLGPVAVLFALSVGGALLGIVGVIAALPLAAVLKVLLERGWQGYQASSFYADPGTGSAPEPPDAAS